MILITQTSIVAVRNNRIVFVWISTSDLDQSAVSAPVKHKGYLKNNI